ncbi:MAG: hypothetical protein AAF502_21085 [Bacteroidota bacterium]
MIPRKQNYQQKRAEQKAKADDNQFKQDAREHNESTLTLGRRSMIVVIVFGLISTIATYLTWIDNKQDAKWQKEQNEAFNKINDQLRQLNEAIQEQNKLTEENDSTKVPNKKQ